MTETVIPYRFLVRGGTAAAVAALNEVVKSRELVFETDTRKFKIGNGVTAYNSLPYVGELANLADPGADSIVFWNNTTNMYDFLSIGTNLSIDTGGALNAASGGGGGSGAITVGTYASRPGSPADGDTHYCTDAPAVLVYGSGTWNTFFRGDIVHPPVLGSFTQVNWGTSSTSALGPFPTVATQKAAAYALRVLTMSAPSTPYIVEAGILAPPFQSQTFLYSAGFRQSSDGKMALGMVDITGTPTIKSIKMNSATAASANYTTLSGSPASDYIRMRFRDDGTNRYIDFHDGGGWVNFHSVARTDFLTANEICIALNHQSGFATQFCLIDWYVH